MLQFHVFGRCLMNEHHGLQENGDDTFYSDLLKKIGIQPNTRLVKVLVRQYLYPALAVIAVVWQTGLGGKPYLF